MTKYTVTIIGLGNIGMMYDYYNQTDSDYLSHAKSFSNHDGFALRNMIDPDRNKLKLAKERFGNEINYLDSIEEFKEISDVIILASTPLVNKENLDLLKNNKAIKIFLIEKPFWNPFYNIADYETISNKCYINYFRKSLPFIKKLKTGIDQYLFGNVIGIHVWYSKGLRNNGSHLIDLTNYLFNSKFDPNSIIIIEKKNDYNQNDESISFSINYDYNNQPFTVLFQTADERHFSLIEFDLIFERSRFRFYSSAGKVEVSNLEKDPLFEGYVNLKSNGIIDTELNKYGLFTCESIYNILLKKMENNSSISNEILTSEVIQYIRNKTISYE